MLIPSQVPVDRRYEMIDIPTLGDGVLDRLINNVYRVELIGVRPARPAGRRPIPLDLKRP